MTTDPGWKVVTVAELWPEHAGHEVRYSEFGRTDYRVTTLELDLSDLSGCRSVSSAEYDPAPIDGDVQETSYWCRDCGYRLRDYWDPEEEPS